MTNISVPFKVEIGELGLREALGIVVYNSKTGLRIEYQTRDALLGVIKSDIETIEIPWNEITAFEVEKKWFSARITIRTASLAYLAQFPWNNGAQVVLKISKDDIETARRLRSELLLLISENRLALLDSNND
ncbi:hypothetical protein EP331_13900 [bacterium]|nr:MAG: hypothetical protein EP331_13900 [bacterium]